MNQRPQLAEAATAYQHGRNDESVILAPLAEFAKYKIA